MGLNYIHKNKRKGQVETLGVWLSRRTVEEEVEADPSLLCMKLIQSKMLVGFTFYRRAGEIWAFNGVLCSATEQPNRWWCAHVKYLFIDFLLSRLWFKVFRTLINWQRERERKSKIILKGNLWGYFLKEVFLHKQMEFQAIVNEGCGKDFLKTPVCLRSVNRGFHLYFPCACIVHEGFAAFPLISATWRTSRGCRFGETNRNSTGWKQNGLHRS